MDSSNHFCQAALELMAAGYRITPCWPQSKRPRGTGWQLKEWTDQTVISHWQHYPTDNLAIITGYNDTFVLDADIYKGADVAEAFAEICLESGIDLTTDVTVKSASGGIHVYFTSSETIGNSNSGIAKEIDIKGIGGAAIVPPSVNADGTPYTWGEAGSLADKPKVRKMPAKLLARVQTSSVEKQDVNIEDAPSSLPEWRLGMKPISNGREEFMSRVVFWIGMELAREAGNVDNKLIWANRAWEHYRPRVLERDGKTLEQDNRGKQMMMAKIHSTHTKISGMLARGEPLNTPDFTTSYEKSDPAELPLPLEFWDQLGDIDPPFDFVEGLLTDGEMSVVYGETNVGKTFYTLDLAVHVALGREYMGREVAQGAVCYVAAEGGGSIRKRIKAFQIKHEIEDAPLAIIPAAVNLMDARGDVERIIEACDIIQKKYDMPVRLVVIDTLSRVMASGNENAPEAMTATIATIDTIRFATGAHTMVVHHSGKSKAAGARGHSSLPAATTTEIELEKITEKSSVAKVKKQRDLELGQEMGFSLEVIEVGIDARGKPTTSCVVKPVDIEANDNRRLTPSEQMAMDIIRNIFIGDYRTKRQGYMEFPGGAKIIVSDHVPQDEIRPWYYRQAGHDGTAQRDIDGENKVSEGTVRKSFNRALNGLKNKGKIIYDGRLVSLPEHKIG